MCVFGFFCSANISNSKSMKKLTFALAAALCCTTTTAVFNACSNNNKPAASLNDATPAIAQKDTTPAFVQMDFTFDATQDMLDYCDIVVKYDDGTGEKSETVETTQWSKSVTVALPATVAFSRVVTIKSDKDAASAEKIAYTNGYNLNYSILNANGEDLGKSGNTFSGSTLSLKGSKLAEAVGKSLFNKNYTFSFDESGKIQ